MRTVPIIALLAMLPASGAGAGDREIQEFRLLSEARQKEILFVESYEELFSPMSLSDCAKGMPRWSRNIDERMAKGLNVGASSTNEYQYCWYRYFSTASPRRCELTKAWLAALPNGRAVRDALGRSSDCLAPVAESSPQSDGSKVLERARRIIVDHRLLSAADLRCSTLEQNRRDGETVSVMVRELHGGRCGGAEETAPRRFTIEINLNTGAARWDNNFPDMEMRPIPTSRKR